MNTTTATTHIDTVRLTAEADQHNAAVIAHSSKCDAFELCDACRRHRANAVARKHVARVEAVRAGER